MHHDFVAYLAGERHTDHPGTASPFIRNFAIELNDGSPDSLRQDLKPFAPHIIGTHDGRDLERAALTYQVITDDIWPRAEREGILTGKDSILGPGIDPLWNFAAYLSCLGFGPWIKHWFRCYCEAQERGDYLQAGGLAGQVCAGLVRRTGDTQNWYWTKALEILDRLCDVGADERPPHLANPAESAFYPTDSGHVSARCGSPF